MKLCTTCKIEKDESEFNKNERQGIQSKCRSCNSEYLKNHYKNNRKYYIDKTKNRRKSIRKFINSLKLKCVRCPENHIACLDFHHLSDKDINIADLVNSGASKEKILQEISKCVVLCSNCHRKLHYNERKIVS